MPKRTRPYRANLPQRHKELLAAAADEMGSNTPRRDPAYMIYEWRGRGDNLPHFLRYVRYLGYRRNLKRLGITEPTNVE